MKNYYNNNMKKIIALLILLNIALPSNAFLWNKKDKTLEKELQEKGYAGKLPNIEEKGEKAKIKVAEPVFKPQQDFDNPAELKPVPDTPAFIDIIRKEDKTSMYLNDAKAVIKMLERLSDCIENQENVQLFVSKGNFLTSNLDYLIKKYDGRPESYYTSFKKLIEVNIYTKSVMNLRKEAAQYQRYMAYTESGSIYRPENIEQQLEYLKEEIDSAILLLKEEG